MIGHRTTPRGILFLLLAATAVAALALAACASAGRSLPAPTPPPGTIGPGQLPSSGPATGPAGGQEQGPAQPVAATGAAAAPKAASVPRGQVAVDPGRMLFPVLGKVQYRDDFGEARGQGPHEGNDVIVARHSPVIAVEDGRVRWWTTSQRAGCMLYLDGASGATYLYIHLNNDATLRNDNRGGCVAGGTYTVADGAKVLAGEQIAWSGDSGDADGNPHLHFEVHPDGGGAVSPFSRLEGAVRTLFPARPGTRASVGIRGVVVTATPATVDVAVSAVRWWPGGRWVEVAPRTVQLSLDGRTAVDPAVEGTLRTASAGSTVPQTAVTIVTRTGKASPEAIAGLPGVLVAQRIRGLA